MDVYSRVGRLALMATLAATLASCGVFRGSDDITGKTIRYQVEYINSPQDALSKDALAISYSTNDGQQEQKNVRLPWTKVVGPAKPGFKASVRAQFNGFGTIICRIVADGAVIEEMVSNEDPYAVVECSAK